MLAANRIVAIASHSDSVAVGLSWFRAPRLTSRGSPIVSARASSPPGRNFLISTPFFQIEARSLGQAFLRKPRRCRRGLLSDKAEQDREPVVAQLALDQDQRARGF